MLREGLRITEEQFKKFPRRKRAHFINSLSGPKSANLIGTIDTNGNTNLSIVSSVVHLGSDPALLGFVIRPDSVPRDTLSNLRSIRNFTINHVHSEITEKAHQTSAKYEKGVSEFEQCDLPEQFLDDFAAPFVLDSRVKMAMKFIREISIQENGTHFIIAQILDVYLPSDILNEDGFVNLKKVNSVAVTGLDSYFELSFLGRYHYAEVGVPTKNIEQSS